MTKMASKKAPKAPTMKLTAPTEKGDMVCKRHGKPLVLHWRRGKDDENAGGCYICPEYGECGYYVSLDLRTRAATDGNGVALGKLLREG